MSKRACRILACPYSKTKHACHLPAPRLPAHLLSSSERSPLYLSLTRFNPRCGCLENILV
ncbi:hypothetical protein ACTXT7_000675 [Hymenolepis weldensis]